MPERPFDQQLVNIIEKLADFVARNGEEFEQITLAKQINNSKFNFIKPGEAFHNFYKMKLQEAKQNYLGEFL
jgi:hypothetical protein